MAELWITCRLLLAVFGGILCQLISASATLRVLNNVTWDTAFYTCHQHGEQLYSTSDITSLSDVTVGSYWIGAKVQYSSWMWTADNTPLFDYVGEVNESQSEHFYQIKYENQASRCYYECQKKHITSVMYVGLQGENCYCITLSPQTVQRENKTACLGNFKENCGTENTMSIYKTDLTISYVTWLLDVDGVCGYIEQSGNIFVKTDRNCNRQRGFVCDCTGNYNNASCYHHDKTHSWFSANSTCSLTKLTKNNAEPIRREMNGGVQYWIGLKRDRQIVWFDSFNKDETLNINITQNGCVLLEKFSNGTTSFSISKCSDIHSAICINIPSSFETATSKEDKTSHKSSVSEKSERETTPFTSVTSAEVKKDQTVGVAVGVSVTLILLVVGAVVVTVWMKRSHKFCFKTKQESSMTGGIRSVNQQNLSDYDEIKPGTDSNYEFETLTNVTMATKPKSSDYEVATDVNAANVQTNSSDYELATDVNAAAGQTNNSYNNNTDEDDYNVLNDSHINNNVNYNHTDINVEGDYDTADSKPKSMSTHDKTYNHIGDVMEGDYDTTAPKSTSSHDETYNHIAAVTEDDYNIADTDLRNVDCTSDDYNHLDSVRG